jgi:HemY protein
MIRVLIYFAVVVLLALGVVWMADHPGTVLITFGGREIETSTLVGAIALLVAAAAVAVGWSIILFVLRVPSLLSGASQSRRQKRGLSALSRGLVAVGTGDQVAALRYSGEADRYLKREPMVLLLKAQAAQMAGDAAGAEKSFAEMLNHAETRALGLRGLYMEARRRNDPEAAYAYAEEALKTATLPWAGEAVLEYRAAHRDWAGALTAVERNAGGRITDRSTASRQRAVLNTALATDLAERNPEEALSLVRDALRTAPTFVPAAALAGKLLTRKGDIRRASKLIETAYSATPHPDLVDAYLNVRPGDSAADRLTRAETLARIAPRDPESLMAVARAALESRDFLRARDTLKPLVENTEGIRPTVNVCRLMAEIEEAEHGETGALYEWLQRAQRAPRDPAWVADGVVSDHWEPVSPVTGRIDAFEWKTPQEQLSRADALDHVRVRGPVEVDAPRLTGRSEASAGATAH